MCMGVNAYPLISGGSIGRNIAGDRKEVVRYISHVTWSTRLATFGPTPGKEQSSSSILETSDSNPSPSRCATCFKDLSTVCNYENWKWRKIYPDFFLQIFIDSEMTDTSAAPTASFSFVTVVSVTSSFVCDERMRYTSMVMVYQHSISWHLYLCAIYGSSVSWT